MARPGKKRLTPLGVVKLIKEGYYADSDAVGLYVQVAHRQRDGKLDRKHGFTRSWIYRYTSPVSKRIRWMGLGSCDVIPLSEARQLARAARRLTVRLHRAATWPQLGVGQSFGVAYLNRSEERRGPPRDMERNRYGQKTVDHSS